MVDQAADADTVDGRHAKAFTVRNSYDSNKDNIVDHAADADTLDGHSLSDFLMEAQHDSTHNNAADSAKALVSARDETSPATSTPISGGGSYSVTTPGTALLSLKDLPCGTYLVYGIAECWPNASPVYDGFIEFYLDNGTTVIQSVVTFQFNGQRYSTIARQSAGFTAVVTLTETTTTSVLAISGIQRRSPVSAPASDTSASNAIGGKDVRRIASPNPHWVWARALGRHQLRQPNRDRR